ncbi:50S ribosomal protein L25 [Gudongella sp. DL1XJH-153]|uniref:50S ribosomal protein L25 n=1 Tax=Gudongella sp. DL1XJH-153 TaxID=3409804 RepID=UPI003BB5CC87
MSDKRLLAAPRLEIGSSSSRKIRREKLVPGIVYSKGQETKHVRVDKIDFVKVFRIVGTSSLMELEVDGEILPVIVKSVQRDPVKGDVIHIDFQKLDMKQKIKITVPVYLQHRDSIKIQPSVLMQMLDTIEIECLPGDIPESVGIDVSGMDFDTPLYVKDLDIVDEENVEVLTDMESIICTLNEPTMEEEEEDEEEDIDATSVPVVGEEEEEE